MLIPDYNRIASRWLIFFGELVLTQFAFICSILASIESGLIEASINDFITAFLLNAAIASVCMIILRTHAGIIRYSSSRDFLIVMAFGMAQFFIWMGISWVLQPSFTTRKWDKLPILLNSLLASLFIITARIVIKEVYSLGWRMSKNRINVLIYGANIHGSTTLQALQGEHKVFRNVVGFIDIGKDKIGKSIAGYTVISSDTTSIRDIIKRQNVREVILSDTYASQSEKTRLLNICNEEGVRLATLAPLSDWVQDGLKPIQIRDMTIEAVLEREVIVIDNRITEKELKDTTILVSGAAGSIGSELCVQLYKHGIRKLVMLDIAESGMHDAMRRLTEAEKLGPEVVMELANIREKDRVEFIMSKHRPDFVYHAAAYKHVPILESFPREATLTNIIGTKILADASLKYGVEKFVMISTDKAVNPTNIMGASKRMAELYVNSLEYRSSTHFITTRFGNVIGSNGSVVPIFKSQIERGGPVTVTHPEISRFFMTIPEASSLVIEASVMGSGGEIFVFDMGSPVRILDMARKMIQLAGLRPELDIRIEFSGLRKGEKLHEELFRTDESPLPTYHPKIMKARHTRLIGNIHDIIDELSSALINGNINPRLIRDIIKQAVPEYSYDSVSESELGLTTDLNGIHMMDSSGINGKMIR